MLTTPYFLEDEEKDKTYSIAPGQDSSPLSIFKDINSEELAIPNIFCGKKRPTNEERKVPVHYSTIVKSELRHKDRRAARSIDNIFFKTKKLQMKQLLDKAQIAMRKLKSKGEKLNAGTFKNKDTVKDFIFKDVAFKFMTNLRGSPPYFQQIAKEVMCMIRQLGPATFFCSFSAAETRWTHLLKILGKVVDNADYSDEKTNNISWFTKARLIQGDPITCARHFDFQCQCLLQFLKAEPHPIGEILDYFYRVEFQQRGR
jgi:hypothetical protein